MNFATIIILVAATIGAVIDFRTRKIPNWLVFTAAALGLVANALPSSGGSGVSGFIWSIVGLLLGVLITAGPNLLTNKNAIHAGDVKLWGAIGVCLMPVTTLICWFYFSIVYGIVSSILIARAKSNKDGDAARARKALIPLCPMIAVGVYLGVFFGRPLMHLMGANWY